MCAPVAAQDEFALEEDETTGSWFGDLLMRGDYAQDLPLNLPDETRGFIRLRGGLRWQLSDWEIGAGIEASRGTESARVVRLAHDNERINDLNVDLLYAQRSFGEHGTLLFGKAPLPLELTSMLWDDDLRPVGASVSHGISLREFDRVQLTAGYFAGDHLYGEHDSRIAALQAAWHIAEGAPVHGGVLLSYLDFSHLDEIAASGLARSNRRIGSNLVSEYELANLTLRFGMQWWQQPFEAELDLVRNLGADDLRDGARVTFTLGDARQAGDWQVRYGYQRIQRDAVMAAFNSEEWWFHSNARGSLLQVGYGITDTWRVQSMLFVEHSDPLPFRTERLMLDLRADF